MKFEIKLIKHIMKYLSTHEKQMEIRKHIAYMGDVLAYPIQRFFPFVRLCTLVALLPYIKLLYKRSNIPDNIILDTFQDITLRLNLYQATFHQDGLSSGDVVWFRHLYHAKIFKLHTLQFQLFEMIYLDESTIGEDYMQFSDEQKRRLPNGTPVINVHVQTGTSLFPINVEQSFKIADEFFPTLFPNHKFKAYVCYSWLFSSGMQQLLPASSNILQFADTFEIIAENHDKEDAIQRIYGKRYRKTSDYPQRTSLQLHALHNFQLLGQGCGIRYRKEK